MSAIRWWSCFFGHRWTRWEETHVAQSQKIVVSSGLKIPTGTTWISTRSCVTCGLTMHRRQRKGC